MTSIDIYRPDQWHDFFIMVGGAAAALTGLVFVAMSLNLEIIVKDLTHKNRAIGTIAGFTAVFAICALALIGGQNYQAVGLELLVVSGIAGSIYVNGYIQAKRRGKSPLGLTLIRLIFGTALYIIEILCAIIFTLGQIMGLYVAAITMVVLLVYTITGAWLLLVGVHSEKSKK